MMTKKMITKKIRAIIPVATVLTLSLSTSATLVTTTSQPACAQTDSSCLDRLMYVTARANSGPTERGEWRFSQQFGPADGSAMFNAGCRQAGFAGVDGWRCPSEIVTFQVMSAAEAAARCNGYVPSDNTYSNPTNNQNQSASVVLNTNGFIAYGNEQSHYFNVVSRNRTIRIEVSGLNGFDPMLRLENTFGNVINENDDYGGGLNSRLVYTLPPGSYRAIVSGFNGGNGNYNIVIQSN